jgi:8-oxo-dGTP pyrophosphatase MutT (NUDIX family)
MVTLKTLQKLPTNLKSLSQEQRANAAVAIIIKPGNGDFEILLVKRAIRANDVWSGQMAFPGGKRELQDATLKATATRETLEETGIEIASSRFLGVLDAVKPMTGSGFLVLPFVVALDKTPQIVLNLTELESYIWVPYEEIRLSMGKTLIPLIGEVPAFLPKNTIVWGMTYKILCNFFKIVESIKTQELLFQA